MTTEASAAGPNPTIADYIQRNGTQESVIKVGDPSAPVVNLPVPDGWQPLSPQQAPGEIRNLPKYQPGNAGETNTLGDYPAYALGGTTPEKGRPAPSRRRPSPSPRRMGLYVLQLNVDGPRAAADVIGAATEKIDSDTRIG